MKYNYALPALAALAGSAYAAPAIVTQTHVVYVTADAATTSASAASSTHAPQVGGIYEVVVSKLVEVKASTTETQITTFTRTKSSEAPTATPSSEALSTLSTNVAAAVVSTEAAGSSDDETTTVAVETTSSSTKATTTLTPTTTSSSTEATTSSTKTSTSTSATATSTGSSDFATAILNAHNEKRALHGVDDLEWDSTLEAYAQAYADAYDCSGTLTHSGGSYGENLGLGYSTTGVVEAWYDEIDDYDWSNPSASHFTQVVWKSTTKLGCGYTNCGSYWGQYTICSYSPAGNVAGEYDDNVLPLV